MSDLPKFSFVIPLYNEAEIFEHLISRLQRVVSTIKEPCEVVLVDDGSTDATARKMEQLAYSNRLFQCIFLSRNFGHQYALTAGLDSARGEYVMILDGDLQDPPELFHEFYEKIQEGYDVVYGIRKKRKEGVVLRAFYSLFYRILSGLSSHPIPLDAGDFSMISSRALRIMLNMREESRFLRGMRSWIGFRQIGVPYERIGRTAGVPKYTLRKLVNLANDGIFNFSTLPIKFLTYMGVTCILISSCYLAFTLVRKFLFNDVPLGFTALLFVIVLFGGVQLVSLGVIGEYVQRIFFEVKDRPLYVIHKRIVNGREYCE